MCVVVEGGGDGCVVVEGGGGANLKILKKSGKKKRLN